MTAGGALLFPGAGSSRTQPALVAVERAMVDAFDADFAVVRADFPYRREGRRAPDRAPKLIACVVEEAGLLASKAGVDPEALVLGGRSMGGRICSMAVAEGLPAAGLALISYPLHPPGREDNLRIAHFPDLHVPCLFVSGTRDPFGTREQLESHTRAIPGPVTHVWIEGGRHDLKGVDAQVAEAVTTWARSL